MTTCPREPNPGEKISASWMRELVRYVRGLRPIQGPGVKVSPGPDGTVISAEGGKASKFSTFPKPFDIRAPKTNDDDDPGGFNNCYFMFGGKIYEADDNVKKAGALPQDKIVCLKVSLASSDPVASIESFASFSLMQEATKNDSVYLFPLYKTDNDKAVTCDLRTVPVMVGREWLS